MKNKMKVGVRYINTTGDTMYVYKMDKNGTLHSSTRPKNYRPFSLSKAGEIQYIIESELKLAAFKVYE